MESFNISIITKMEFLGCKGHTEQGFIKSTSFINKANIINLDDEIISKTIDIKRKDKIKLIDAIICSTALVNKMQFITRNTTDFSMIENIKLINPFKN